MDKDGTPDLLFSVEPEYQGKGLATESGARVIAYACAELGIRQIVATVDKPNLDSIRVLEKLGMQRTEEKLVSGNALLFYSYVAVV
jgi:RimJ/RimL family protein N-acetyltransferase